MSSVVYKTKMSVVREREREEEEIYNVKIKTGPFKINTQVSRVT